MKRIVALIAALTLTASLALVALAGCADQGKQNAIDAYKQASAATMLAKNADYDIAYDYTASYSGFAMKGTGNGRLQYIMPDNPADFDKLQLAFDFDTNINVLADKLQLKIGTYLKDGNLYLSFDSNQEYMPASKVYFSLTDVLESVLGEMLGSAADLDKALGNLDLGKLLANVDYQKLLEQSGLQINIDKYILAGSFDGTTITLDIDVAGLTKEAIALAMKQSGNALNLQDMTTMVSQMENMLTNAKATITATVDDKMMFTSTNFTMNLDLNMAAQGAPAGPGGNSTMNVTINASCPSIKTNTVTSVDYPNLKGYQDITNDVKKMASEMLTAFLGQMMKSTMQS